MGRAYHLKVGDRVRRFLKAALIGDTVTVDYEVTAVDPKRSRTTASVTVRNQNDETLAVAQHILKWVSRPPAIAADRRR